MDVEEYMEMEVVQVEDVEAEHTEHPTQLVLPVEPEDSKIMLIVLNTAEEQDTLTIKQVILKAVLVLEHQEDTEQSLPLQDN